MRVLVPDYGNLEFMSFWIALGGGFFQKEGLDVQVVTPPQPQGATQVLFQGGADIAVLPPPMYLALIGQQRPVLVFANLRQNDQIGLIVRKDVFASRGLSAGMSVADCLKGMRRLRIGVAPGHLHISGRCWRRWEWMRTAA